ncbi:carboxymuconolactone decarboxylase family protein [Micromonospora sp. DT47]|uniref:carboxymuconolactone decarboxylase family protein n=1 Tax=Micromonospora sp. DT47 TaxID=3393431 RepID=UPI003CF8AAA2
MSTIPAVDAATATREQAAALADVRKALGSVPNMAKVMANSPAAVKAWLALSGALGEGTLPAPVRERLALATAEYNQCGYCLSAHTFLASKVAKVEEAEIELARKASSADPHIAALLELSDAIARNRGAVSEVELQQARAAGVTDEEIIELVGNLALNILTNYTNILADTDNELPAVRPLQHA